MLIIYFLGIALIMLITLNILSALMPAIFGNHFISFFGRAYTKRPETTFDKGLNIVFYLMHGIPYFFYIHFMKKYSYWRARLVFGAWTIGFILICIIILILVSLLLESLGF
ncbi:hypothetical protein [Alkalihalophilus marmarensis]|jgi:hypothetical protein|uniref:Uncharacterized protein n=1 Tax=Alkalihalophilus marmarensis DSM 21297 TaxID=1188261 RepID=U6STH4_9BACI|nr:hypothetical protein [Alkalihalophilus marmarensis]ERN54913.1 hypothetical protein A33I_04360 [Alkalihalophilus marmarensis DSM 21297]MCM3491773.1 hypothetical protein [Alkalihalophilus marmarensis]MEC2073249.1 hypothetical protein [Alkalihalophilus marmarensis]